MATTVYKELHFKGFSALTKEGKTQHSITIPGSANWINNIEFVDTVFEDIDGGPGFLKFKNPNPSWANPTDCGEFPCTGPKNVIVSFKGTKYLG